MTTITAAEILAALALIAFALACIRLYMAHREAKWVTRLNEELWLAPPPPAKLEPTLTPAQIAEFHAMRWDGD